MSFQSNINQMISSASHAISGIKSNERTMERHEWTRQIAEQRNKLLKAQITAAKHKSGLLLETKRRKAIANKIDEIKLGRMQAKEASKQEANDKQGGSQNG